MFFGEIEVAEAAGATLVHTVRAGSLTMKKGRPLSAEDVAALAAAGVGRVTVTRLEPGDVAEDAAAARVAAALAGPGLTVSAAFTGRVNLFADADGVVTVDAGRLDALNLGHESVTVATLPAFAAVTARQMVATIKIIPFAAPEAAVAAAERIAGDGPPILKLHPYRTLSVALIQTTLPAVKPSVLDKTVEVTRARLDGIAATLTGERRAPHSAGPLAAAIRETTAEDRPDLVLVAGASAITDRRDALPAGIVAAGGEIAHFGMPVDPGNLLLFGTLPGGVPVIGLPGCARSPKLNGFDWVLQRLAAGLPMGAAEIMRMGVGGLLAEIPSRPLPRERATDAAGPPRAPRVAALVLAGGQSRRMGAINKLTQAIDGVAMVARVVDQVSASDADPVVVVTGHEADQVMAALAGRTVSLTHNPDFAGGLSTSLKAGLAALDHLPPVDAVLVCLGDMPRVTAAEINRLIAAYNPVEGRSIAVPTVSGKRGNPVLFDRHFFEEMASVEGDTGAKHLIGQHADQVVEVPMDGDGALVDVDTPDALARINRA